VKRDVSVLARGWSTYRKLSTRHWFTCRSN